MTISTPPTALQIAALIADPVYTRWNATGLQGTNAFVTYSFAKSVAPYDDAAERPGFAAMNAQQMASVRIALEKWASVCGLAFLEIADQPGADMRFGIHDFQNTVYASASGYAYYPSIDPAYDYRSDIGGDVWINSSYLSAIDNRTLSGPAAQHLLVHEIGHAIGLKHSFDGAIVLPTADDTVANTVMAYAGDATTSTQPKPLDIAAARSLYGAADPAYFWDAPHQTLTIYGSALGESLNGAQVNDIVAAGGGADIIHGNGGADWLFGGDGADRVFGDDGDDVLYGDINLESGADYLDGGYGNDIAIGGLGVDTLYGRAGNDWLFGSGGSDFGYGGEGDDVFYGDLFAGEYGDDVAEGDEGADILIGGAGIDTLFGGFINGAWEGGNDWLFGGGDGDFLFGQAGNDVLYGDLFAGEIGTDTLDGGDGDDFLWGGPGDDVLIGGAGTDQYWLGEGRDTIKIASAGELAQDVAMDFVAGSGGDRIDLRGMGLSTFATDFAGFRAAYLRADFSDSVLDFDGPGGATRELILKGVNYSTLTADNFQL